MARQLFDEEMFMEEPPSSPAPPSRGGLGGETARRIWVALPWIAFAIVITILGELPFTIALIAIGLLCLRELFVMTASLRPVEPAAYVALAALLLAAHFGTSFDILLAGAASFPLLFFLAADRREREGVTVSIAITVLGVVWIGVPLAHAVLLRDLPNHGAALLIDVLVGTFLTDTGAYAIGRMFGARKLAPRLSPRKTVEGLVGGFLIGTLAFWFAGLYQDWLSGADALLIGAAVAAVAPVGDLFESLVKRDLGRKDTGTIFGAHGGLLDRLDALLFTVVVAYYLAVGLLY